MPMDLRFSLPAAAITTVVAAVIVVRAVMAPAPTPRRKALPLERADIASKIATQEKDWTRQVGENFPQDNWSQRDDFHGREFREVLKLSNEKGVRVEDVLRSIDDDIHKQSGAIGPKSADTRAAHAVPCKPRPFYD